MIKVGTARSEYERMHSKRSEALDRAEKAARVTIPSLFPPEGHSRGNDLKDPYQSLGARAVNTLASKIMLALFPPNTPFFSLGFDVETQAKLGQNDIDMGEIQSGLSLIENAAVDELEATNMRPVMNTAVRLLIATGNTTIRVDDKGKFKVFTLRQYVVRRDPGGTVVDLIIHETVDPNTLSTEIVDQILTDAEKQDMAKMDPVDIYTVMTREPGGRFKVWQEARDKMLDGTDGDYSEKTPPFLTLRWTELPGEHYGRGMVDQYYGDFKALDDLNRDLLKASASAAKIIWMRNPGSMVSKRKLEKAESGDILDGNPEDVQALTLDKFGDFQVTLERIRDIRTELVEAFLMRSTVQRDAERVTAEEIRFVAQELEDALGGVYSLLAQELQAPLARRWLKIAEKKTSLPNLPDDEVRLTVTTGLDALGRGHEVQKLLAFTRTVRDSLGEEFLAQRINGSDFLKRLSAGLGLSINDLIKDEQQVAQEQQRQQLANTAQQAAPGVAQELAKQQSGGNNG